MIIRGDISLVHGTVTLTGTELEEDRATMHKVNQLVDLGNSGKNDIEMIRAILHDVCPLELTMRKGAEPMFLSLAFLQSDVPTTWPQAHHFSIRLAPQRGTLHNWRTLEGTSTSVQILHHTDNRVVICFGYKFYVELYFSPPEFELEELTPLSGQ